MSQFSDDKYNFLFLELKINKFLLSGPKNFHLSNMGVFTTMLVLQDNDLNIHRSDIRPINRKYFDQKLRELKIKTSRFHSKVWFLMEKYTIRLALLTQHKKLPQFFILFYKWVIFKFSFTFKSCNVVPALILILLGV